jgi:hypothetical protein
VSKVRPEPLAACPRRSNNLLTFRQKHPVAVMMTETENRSMVADESS